MGHLKLDSRALALVAILFVVGYVVSTLYQWARLRHFKGPALAGFSQLWLISTVGGGRTHLDLWEACKKYGKSCDGHLGISGACQVHDIHCQASRFWPCFLRVSASSMFNVNSIIV